MLLHARRDTIRLLLLLAAAAAGPAAANTFTFVPDTGSPSIANWNWHVTIDNADAGGNATIEVKTGSTYSLDVSASLSHPFWIDESPGLGGSLGTNPYAVGSGLSDNGITTATTLTLNLPADAPDTLYYACGNHTAMTGTITVVHDLVFRANFD